MGKTLLKKDSLKDNPQIIAHICQGNILAMFGKERNTWEKVEELFLKPLAKDNMFYDSLHEKAHKKLDELIHGKKKAKDYK